MAANVASDPEQNAGRFYAVVKSIHEFDKIEVNGVILNLLNPTNTENCFVGTYIRTQGNVETLLRLDKSKDFQAIAMLARSLFELAVDSRLLELIPNGWIKMIAYTDLEKLRSAEKILRFKENNPSAGIESAVYSSFVARHSARIKGIRATTWPNVKNLNHWSGFGLRERVARLGAPFDRMYEVEYPALSWYTHSGLTGVLNIPAVAFIHVCASAFYIAATAYEELLLSMIRVFKISRAIEDIEKRLQRAKMLPFTNGEES